MVEITKDEAESLMDLIETNIFKIIRDDIDIDSIKWLDNIMCVYRKCKEREQEC